MASASAIIGKVAVKVIPNTKTFKKEAQTELDKIEKELGEVEVKLKPTIDGQDIKRKAKTLQQEVQASMTDIKLRVDIDNQESLKKNLALLEHQLSRMNEMVIDVALNKEDIQAGIEMLQEQLDKVANIDIRVDPENLASVKAALSTVEAELAKFREETINVRLDEAELKAAKVMFEEQLVELQKEANLTIQANLDENRVAEQRVIDDVKRRLNSIQFAPGVDTTKLAATRAEIEAYLIKIAGLQSKIKLGLDPIALRTTQLEIDALEAKIRKIVVDVKPEVDKTKLASVLVTLGILTKDRKVNIAPMLNNKATALLGKTLARLAGATGLLRFTKGLAEFFNGIDRNILKIASLTTAFLGLGGVLAGSATHILSLGAGLLQMLPAALALPGLFVGLGIGIAAAAVVLKDFNTQFSQLAIGGPGKALTAGAWWKQLQDMMSADFWTKVKAPMQDMLTVFLPQIQSGLMRVADSLGSMFSNLATSLKNDFGKGAIQDMLNNVATFWSTLGTHTDAFASIMRILGELGTSLLPRLANFIGLIADKWAAWLFTAEQSGKLNTMVEQAITLIDTVGRIGLAIGGIFKGLFAAIGNSGALQSLETSLNHIADIVNSEPFHSTLQKTFKAFADAISTVVTAVGPTFTKFITDVAKLLQKLLPILAQGVSILLNGLLKALDQPAVMNGFLSFFQGLLVAINAIAPVFGPLGQLLGDLFTILGNFFRDMGPSISRLLMDIANALVRAMPAISSIVDNLSAAFADLLDAIGPYLDVIVQGLVGILQAIANPSFLGSLTQLIKDLLPLANFFIASPLQVKILIGALTVLADVIMLVLKAFEYLFVGMLNFFGSIANTMVRPVLWILDKLGIIDSSTRTTLNNMFDSWQSMTPQIMNQALTLGTGVNSSFTTGFNGPGLANNTGTALDGIGGVLTNKGSVLTNSAFQVGTTVTNGWKNGLSGIATSASSPMDAMGIAMALKSGVLAGIARAQGKAIADSVTTGFKEGQTDLSGAGGSIIDSLINGMKQKVPAVQGFLTGLTAMLPKWKGPEATDAKLLSNAGVLVMNGFLDGLESRYDAIRKSLEGFTSDLGDSTLGVFGSPSLGGQLSAVAAGAYAGGSTSNRTLIYNAAPGNSLSSEEDLFAAAGRSARMGGF